MSLGTRYFEHIEKAAQTLRRTQRNICGVDIVADALIRRCFPYFRNWPFAYCSRKKPFSGWWFSRVNAILEPGDDPRWCAKSTNLERLSGYAEIIGLS